MNDYRRGRRNGRLQASMLIGSVLVGGLVMGYLREQRAASRIASEADARLAAEQLGATLARRLTAAEQAAGLDRALAELAERGGAAWRERWREQSRIVAHWRVRADRVPATITMPGEIRYLPGEPVPVPGDCVIGERTTGWDCDGVQLNLDGRILFQLRGRSWADAEISGQAVHFGADPDDGVAPSAPDAEAAGWRLGRVLEASIDDPTPPDPGKKYSARWIALLQAEDNGDAGPLAIWQVEWKRWGVAVGAGAMFREVLRPVDGEFLVRDREIDWSAAAGVSRRSGP